MASLFIRQRPRAIVQHRYQWCYLYAFVHPSSGRTWWLLLPTVSVAAFTLALREFAQAVSAARFDKDFLRGLEDEPRTPRRRRTRQYTARRYERVVFLRRQHLRYGKMKLLELYRRKHPGDLSISAWKIQCIIHAAGLYYDPPKQARINRKRSVTRTRKKITELKRKPVSGILLCVDTVVRYWHGQKRYILTAIDRHTKVAFARMYTTHSSASARDFLYRLHLLLDGKIENVQTDNGSEFHRHFETACLHLNLEHYWSRIKTRRTMRLTSDSTARCKTNSSASET